MFGLHEIFKCAYLKFTVYGHKPTDIHTHASHNAVWDSLRLTQINKSMCCKLKWTHKYVGSVCCAPLNGCVYYYTHTVNKMGVLSTQGTCCVHTVNKRNVLCTYCQHKEHVVYILSTQGTSCAYTKRCDHNAFCM